MKEVKLTLNELLILDRELNGIFDSKTNQVVVKGILSHKMNVVAKYRLSKLSKIVIEEKDLYSKLRNDLVQHFADNSDAEPQNLKISSTIKDANGNDIPNPNYQNFLKELDSLGKEEKVLSFPEIKIEDLDFETDEYYPVFFDKVL